MESHSVTHTGEKLWKCSECSCSFTHLRGLQGHMNLHTDNAKACELGCGKMFPTLNSKAYITKNKNLGKWAYEPIRLSSISDRKPEGSKVVFRCKLCEKLFDNYVAVQNHIQIHKASYESTGEVRDEVVISIEVDKEEISQEEFVIDNEDSTVDDDLNKDAIVDDDLG